MHPSVHIVSANTIPLAEVDAGEATGRLRAPRGPSSMISIPVWCHMDVNTVPPRDLPHTHHPPPIPPRDLAYTDHPTAHSTTRPRIHRPTRPPTHRQASTTLTEVCHARVDLPRIYSDDRFFPTTQCRHLLLTPSQASFLMPQTKLNLHKPEQISENFQEMPTPPKRGNSFK